MYPNVTRWTWSFNNSFSPSLNQRQSISVNLGTPAQLVDASLIGSFRIDAFMRNLRVALYPTGNTAALDTNAYEITAAAIPTTTTPTDLSGGDTLWTPYLLGTVPVSGPNVTRSANLAPLVSTAVARNPCGYLQSTGVHAADNQTWAMSIPYNSPVANELAIANFFTRQQSGGTQTDSYKSFFMGAASKVSQIDGNFTRAAWHMSAEFAFVRWED